MYLLIKSIFSVGAIICLGIVTSQILFADILLGFLLLISLFLIIFGDIFIGWKVTPFKALFEPTPPGKELMELQLLDGKTHFINTNKGPQGKREFRMNGHDASVINDGKAQFRVEGGNIGFRGHELIDRNVDPFRCKALSKYPGDNIKEIFHLFKNKMKRSDM